jgi:hypothetical protein
VWEAIPAADGKGWVVRHRSGLQQHGGCKYDQATAQRWAETLSAYYRAWGLCNDNTGGSENEQRDTQQRQPGKPALAGDARRST